MRSNTTLGPDRAYHAIPPAIDSSDSAATAEPKFSPTEAADHDAPLRVLFLCTHNSARSQVAEAVLRLQGGPRVQAFSAGSHPTGVHPMAAALLEQHGVDVGQLRSKSMDEFAGQSFDYVISLCDGVRDICPAFPGDPIRIHWSFPDPSIVEDEAARSRAFATLWLELNLRIGHLLNLPHPSSGRRPRPESLAGLSEAPLAPRASQLAGATGKLGALAHRLHLRHDD